MYMRDAKVPFETLEQPSRPFYNLDDYKQENVMTAQKIYQITQQYMEEGRIENEGNFKKNKALPVQSGDRVCLRNVPKPGEPKKLHALWDGPYRVIDKIINVVIKVRKIREGPVKPVHTNNVKIIYKDNVDSFDVKEIRQAYPWNIKNKHKNDIPQIKWLNYDCVYSSPPATSSTDSNDNGGNNNSVHTEPIVSTPSPAHSLRSST